MALASAKLFVEEGAYVFITGRLFRPYFSNTACDAKLCCFTVLHP
jgi:hypothetical protein